MEGSKKEGEEWLFITIVPAVSASTNDNSLCRLQCCDGDIYLLLCCVYDCERTSRKIVHVQQGKPIEAFVSDIRVLSQHHTELMEAYHPTASVVLSHVSTRC